MNSFYLVTQYVDVSPVLKDGQGKICLDSRAVKAHSPGTLSNLRKITLLLLDRGEETVSQPLEDIIPSLMMKLPQPCGVESDFEEIRDL